MKTATPPGPSYPLTWCVFAAVLLFTVVFIASTGSDLPATVASHFDAAGQPNAFMSHAGYLKFVMCLALGLPIGVVTVLTAVYSRAPDMKLPNRDYWLAPERIANTRKLLIAHGVWLGSLLAALVCFVHWLELGANRLQPPHLSNQLLGTGLVAFLIGTAAWIATLMVMFRRPMRG